MNAPVEKKKRKLYWLGDKITQIHRDRGLLLEKIGFQVQFFSTFDIMAQEIMRLRVGIIILNDDMPVEALQKNINHLITMPEIQGARFILSVSAQNKNVTLTAACSAFRDLIPIDLEERAWLARFVYAVSKNSIDYPESQPQVAVNHIASVAIPSRLVWISSRRVLFEAKVRPAKGTNLHLSGALATALGQKSVNLVVEETRHNDLMFRFSDAVIAHWNVPDTAAKSAQDLITRMRQTDFGPRCKVFLAIQDNELRSEFTKNLDNLRFEVNIALQKQSIIDEPKYFSPQIVFVEDRLCTEDNFERFQAMLENLMPDVPVYIIGTGVNLKNVQSAIPHRKIGVLPKVPTRISDAIFTRLLPPSSRKSLLNDDDATFITPDHPFSSCEIICSARITKIHPTAIQVGTPLRLGVFGLVKVDSPFLHKVLNFSPYAKIYRTYDSATVDSKAYNHVADCYFSDVPRSDQKKLAVGLAKLVSDQLIGVTLGNQLIERAIAKASPQAVVGKPSPFEIPTVNSAEFAKPTLLQAAKTEIITKEDVSKVAQSIVNDIGDGLVIAFDKTKKTLTGSAFKTFAQFVAYVTVSIGLLWFLATYIAPYWQHSGGNYSDSLKKFAPNKFEQSH